MGLLSLLGEVECGRLGVEVEGLLSLPGEAEWRRLGGIFGVSEPKLLSLLGVWESRRLGELEALKLSTCSRPSLRVGNPKLRTSPTGRFIMYK